MRKFSHREVVIAILAISICTFFALGLFFFRSALENQGTLEEATSEYICISSDREFIPPNPSHIATQRDDLNLAFSSLDTGDIEGGIVLDIAEREDLGTLHLETPQDPLTIMVSNGNFEMSNLLLKIFYNYKETAFWVEGAERAETEFFFELDAGYRVDIPIRLPDNLETRGTMSKLTVGIFQTPEHFTGNMDSLSDELVFARLSHNAITNFDINYGYSDDLVLNVDHFEPFDESEFFGFVVHTEPETYGEGALASPGLPVIARSGEELELTLFANVRQLNSEEWVGDVLLEPYFIDDFAVIAMLGWQQIPMSSKPFMWVNIEGTNPNFGQHVSFSIVAPYEPGFYEFSAFVLPSPTRRISERNFFPIETVPRFTVEVIAAE